MPVAENHHHRPRFTSFTEQTVRLPTEITMTFTTTLVTLTALAMFVCGVATLNISRVSMRSLLVSCASVVVLFYTTGVAQKPVAFSKKNKYFTR